MVLTEAAVREERRLQMVPVVEIHILLDMVLVASAAAAVLMLALVAVVATLAVVVEVGHLPVTLVVVVHITPVQIKL
jgi:hypothetical protein